MTWCRIQRRCAVRGVSHRQLPEGGGARRGQVSRAAALAGPAGQGRGTPLRQRQLCPWCSVPVMTGERDTAGSRDRISAGSHSVPSWLELGPTTSTSGEEGARLGGRDTSVAYLFSPLWRALPCSGSVMMDTTDLVLHTRGQEAVLRTSSRPCGAPSPCSGSVAWGSGSSEGLAPGKDLRPGITTQGMRTVLAVSLCGGRCWSRAVLLGQSALHTGEDTISIT
jgi:hypothetical protein